MNKKQISDLSHELFGVVAGSLSRGASISETVVSMNKVIQEALECSKKKKITRKR
jgi:hypothetical protein